MTPLGSRTTLYSSSPYGSLVATPSASASWNTFTASVSPSSSSSVSSSASVSVSALSSVSGDSSSYSSPTASASATTSRSAYSTPTAVATVYYTTVYTSTETSQAGIIIGSTSLGTLFIVVAGATYYIRLRCKLNTDIYKEPGEDTEVKTVDPEAAEAAEAPEDAMAIVLTQGIDEVIDQTVEVVESELTKIPSIDMPNSIPSST